jgi:hypothetical protein
MRPPRRLGRVIASGGRPLCRLGTVHGGRWTVELSPLPLSATERRAALIEARAAIAEWLDVDPEAFDVEASRTRSGTKRPVGE